MVDAYQNHYDEAFVISQDSDIIPAITDIKKIFRTKKIHNRCIQKMQNYMISCDTCEVIPFGKIKKHNEASSLASEDSLSGLKNHFGKK